MSERVKVRFEGNGVVVSDGSGAHPWHCPVPQEAQEHVERALLRMYELGRNDKAREIAAVLEPTRTNW
jgi:hypothetical protein